MVVCIALVFVPAHAESFCGVQGAPVSSQTVNQNFGLVAGSGTAPDGQSGMSCTFPGSAFPFPHEYVAAIGMGGFKIFIDTNSNQRFEPGRGEELLAETGDAPVGQLAFGTGVPVTVQLVSVGGSYGGFVFVR